MLEQLRLVELQRKAGTSNPGWRGLLDLLLKLQGRLPEGGIASLLMLFVRHTVHAQQLGTKASVQRPDTPNLSAFEQARRQAAGLQTCLTALVPLWSMVAHRSGQITLAKVSQSLLLAGVKKHLEKQGQDAIEHDIASKSEIYKAAYPPLAVCVHHYTEVNTLSHLAHNPASVQLADFWAHE